MIKELWGSFPRLLEQNINGLLDGAMPNRSKAFMLYKAFQHEDLWHDTFERFSHFLDDFYSRPRAIRKKSDFDRNLNRPMDQNLYGEFHLNFKTADVADKSLNDLASWAHNMMRVAKGSRSEVISLAVMTETLRKVTHPLPHEKSENIEFEDFCEAWKKIVFRAFGKKHDAEFAEILHELIWLNSELKESENNPHKQLAFPTIYLTQTEIQWTEEVYAAVLAYAAAPKFPLARGAQKQRLMELERCVALYMIVQNSDFPELMRHRENIRTTILDRCTSILFERASQVQS